MKKLLCIVVAMLTIVGREVYAQIDPKEEQRYLQMLTPPGVSDLFRAHMADVSLYTGKMNFSIPLYEIKDPDFPLTISLDYNAEGFKPRKHSGIAGYNWALNAGGCITREVNLFPDEVIEYNSNRINQMGMLWYLQNEMPSPDSVFAFSESVFPTNADAFTRTYAGVLYDIDYQPDIFYFDFCGYHGSFMIDNYGNPTIINGDFVEVDLSRAYQCIDNSSTIQHQSIYLPETISKISIQTLDGFTYEFGGDVSCVGCSVSFKKNTNFPFSIPTPVINTWYLQSIIAPNGRRIELYYRQMAKEPLPINSPLWIYNEEYILGSNLYDPYENPPYPSRDGFIGVYPVNTITKECIIDSIKVTDEQPLKISFSYQEESSSMYPLSAYRITNSKYLASKNYQLSNMQVSTTNRVLKSISFTHETKAGGEVSQPYSWRFLKSVNIDGYGTYSMSYNHPNRYPSLEDNSPDGYFLCYDIDGYWETRSLNGLLSEITIPTGGRQIFQYENHRYNSEHYYETGPDEAISFRIDDSGAFINGARISKIITQDKNGVVVEEKEYMYPSGVYYNRHNIKMGNYGYLPIDNLPAYSHVKSSIGYPQVVEKVYSVRNNTNTLNELNKYYFSSDEDALPTTGSLNKVYDWDYISNGEHYYGSIDYYRIISRFLMFGDNLTTLGKLIKKEVFSQTEATLRQMEYYYYNNCSNNGNDVPPSIIPQMSKDTITIYSCLLGIPLTRRLYTYPDVFTQKNICSYSGNNELHKTEAYYHDEKQRITKQITFDSDSIEHFTYYRYPDELHASRLSTDVSARALYMLTEKGQVAKPIETYSGVKMQNTEYVTSGSVTKYFTDLPFNHAVPAQWRNHHVYPSQVYSLALATPVSNYQPSYISVGLLKIDNHYQLSKSYQLDSLLRPISVTPVGGPTTTYTWNGFYPDSVTVGSQITTYTSIPHVGITSITDPKGLTTYYSYDAYGRLVEVYHMFDNVKQIINAYNYHISNE